MFEASPRCRASKRHAKRDKLRKRTYSGMYENIDTKPSTAVVVVSRNVRGDGEEARRAAAAACTRRKRRESESRGMQVTLANAHMLALARRLDLHARIIRRSERPRLAADSRRRRGGWRAQQRTLRSKGLALWLWERKNEEHALQQRRSRLYFMFRAHALSHIFCGAVY